MDDPHSYEETNVTFKNKLKNFFSFHYDSDDVTEEEIISMVDEGNEQGVLQDNEAEMIRNIFELNDTNVKEIMTHRSNMIGLSCEMTIDEALDFVLEQNYSRFPVYYETIDNLIGILHLRDIIKAWKENDPDAVTIGSLKNVLRPIFFVPETRSIDRLFSDMQHKKNHMVVVIDEYGQTAGIVTMEDILEEIVGNIQDEYDEEEDNIVKDLNGNYLINGLTSLEEIEENFDISFDDNENETLNGYLISKLERIPSNEEKIEIHDEFFVYRILKIENNIISRVLVKLRTE